MSDQPEQFESVDIIGSVGEYGGTISTTPVAFPVVAGNAISEFLVLSGDNGAKKLYVSIGGSTYWPSDGIGQNGHVAWSPKGRVTQIYLKGSAANTKYTVIINFEPN